LISIWVSKKWTPKFRFKSTLVFVSLYLIASFVIVPFIAPLFGRERIQTTAKLQPAAYATILLNRSYVTPHLNTVLQEISAEIPLRFLDANFPFIDKFPLLPHLSHNDGRKIDLSFIYETQDGTPSNQVKSTSGYGVFEGPRQGEENQTAKCLSSGYFQYDYPKYLTFGTKNTDLRLSESGTRELLLTILKNNRIEKVFIEPHLVKRLNLADSRIRFHGCRAVRHDDHIHVQIKD